MARALARQKRWFYCSSRSFYLPGQPLAAYCKLREDNCHNLFTVLYLSVTFSPLLFGIFETDDNTSSSHV
jgi:hypothetical protein